MNRSALRRPYPAMRATAFMARNSWAISRRFAIELARVYDHVLKRSCYPSELPVIDRRASDIGRSASQATDTVSRFASGLRIGN